MSAAVLGDISNSLNDLNTAFNDVLEKQSGCLIDNSLQSQQVDPGTIKSYLEEIRLHEKNQQNLLEQIRLGFSDEIGKEVEEQLRSELDDVIRSEVLKQVEEQVNAQIVEHIPISFQKQAEESNEQVRNVQTSLTNSKSRIANSRIQSGDLDEPLAPILNSEGKRSSLYPSNLRSLFAYDVETAKMLNKDCGLVEAEEIDKNLKQFLAHIGTRVEVVVQGTEDM